MNLFIIGAGFTKAIFPDAPLNSELIHVLAANSPQSPSTRLSDLYKTDNIENALTKLDVDIASSQNATLSSLRREIESELTKYFSSFYASYDLIDRLPWLGQLIDDVFSPGDVIISLNYDCVLEGALDCREKWTPNGGYGSSLDHPLASNDSTMKSPVTVLKIHGSANFIIAPYLDKPTASAVNYDFDERFFPRSTKHTHFEYGTGTGQNYVIAPSYVKIPTVEISYLMLDALTASSNAKNLVIIGSALRPEDSYLTLLVTIFLRQKMWRSRKIVVVDPEAESISNRLKNYWGVDVSEQVMPIPEHLQTSVPQLMAAIKN